MKATPTSSLYQNICSVKPPALPSNYHELVELRYRRAKGVAAANSLSQGERDILEMARQALGWGSIYSLAYKWYPLYPSRHCWQRALEKCHSKNLRTHTLNLKYLLLTVITQVQYSLKSAYSGKGALNRLLHSQSNNNNGDGNRLLHTPLLNSELRDFDDPDKFIKGRYSHMVIR